MRKTDDRRVRMTKMILAEALLTLMKEKPISKITPTELCRVADINRNTFYAHYNYPEELLEEIEDGLYKQIEKSLEQSIKKGNVKSLLIEICQAIKDNKDLCTIVLSENSEGDFLSRLISVAYDKTIKQWRAYGINYTDDELKTFFIYEASGNIAIIRKWVNDGMTESPNEIADLLDKINQGIDFTLAKNIKK